MLRRILFTTFLFGAATSAALAVVIPSEGRSMPQAMVESGKATVIEQFVGDASHAYRIEAAPWVSVVTTQASKQSMSVDGERAKQIGRAHV